MKTLFQRVFDGNDAFYELALDAVNNAEAKLGADAEVKLDTAYYLPCLYALTGIKVRTIGECKKALTNTVQGMMTRHKRTKDIFTSGAATALCAEMIEAMKYCMEEEPYKAPITGHMTDAAIRELGVPLVTGDIPGVAVIIGAAPTAEETANLVKEYQSQGIFVTLIGKCIDHCMEKGIKLGQSTRVVALGYDLSAVVHAVSVTLRAAFIFGNKEAGDYEGMWKYTMERMKAFVNAFAPIDDMTLAAGAGAIQLGFPVITNESKENDIYPVPMSIILQPDISKFNATSLEARGIKISMTKIDIPVAFSSAFEGEIVRRGDMQIEFDGSRKTGLELVRMKEAAEVEDHKFTLIGDDIDKFAVGSKVDFAVIAEVGGKKMTADFESVFERKFHSYVNCIEGIMHTGQRDLVRLRISKDAYNAGFRLKDLAEVLYIKLKNDFAAVIDRCQITIVTDPAEAKRIREEIANPIYDRRDSRLKSMTDESVDKFYTCIMCQSFSPSHVCIVTPERLGLCGAVSWLDAKATNELDENGPCQIVPKEHVIDEKVGRWEEVDEAVNQYSKGALEHVTLYSIMEDPMTSCGCFECICGIEPFSNGVVIVNREHSGMTPLGMTFSEMASMTGGGMQTPGFMGHGKHFIASKKFMKAEGGVARIVWMPKELKDQVRENLDATAKALYGIENFTDMIADESICSEDPDALTNFLAEVGHPVLEMEPMM